MSLKIQKEPLKTKFISGVSDIASHYDSFMIDLWGVVHNGVQLNPGTVECLEQLQAHDKKYVFLTNASFRDVEMEALLKDRFGLSSKYHEGRTMPAGESARRDIVRFKGKNTVVLGQTRDVGLFEGLNIVNDVEHADCINTAGSMPEPEYDQYVLPLLEKALKLKLPLICSNPDIEVEVGDQIVKCAGYYAQWYEDRGGEVHWHGKPYRPVYDMAWEMLGKPDKSKICAIGDSLRTDMAGAQNFGIDGLWNLDGINRDLNEAQALELLEEKSLRPVAMMKGFSW